MNVARLGTLIAIMALPLFASCATLLKGPHARVRVFAPPEARVEDSKGATIPYQFAADGSRFVKLHTDETRYVTVALDSTRVPYRLEPTLNGMWLILDLFAFWPVAIAVDASTHSWNDFGDQAIVFARDSLDTTGARILTQLPAVARRPPIGLILRAGFGAANPVAQAVLGPNHYAFGAGYAINEDLAVLIHHSFQSCIVLGRFEGTTDHRPHPYCFTTSRQTSLDARVHMFGNVYATIGAGAASVEADSIIVRGNIDNSRAGFATSIPFAEVGFGYYGEVLFIEYRHQLGLARIPVGGGVTASLELGTIHFGLQGIF